MTVFEELVEAGQSAKQREAFRRLGRLVSARQVEPDGRLPSERALAQRLGISRPTLRQMMDLMRRRKLLRKTPNGRGWLLDLQTVCQETTPRTIAVASCARSDDPLSPEEIGGSQTLRFHQGVLTALREGGAHMLRLHADNLAGVTATWLQACGVLGIVVELGVCPESPLVPLIEAAAARGIAVAICGECGWLPSCDQVFSDHAAGAELLVNWLVEEKGCRRLLRLGGGTAGSQWRERRDAGCRAAIAAHGLEPVAPLVAVNVFRRTASTTAVDAQLDEDACRLSGHLAPYLTGDHPIDAILTDTDQHAFTVARALRRFHLEPNRDVVVVGYDNYAPYIEEHRLSDWLPAATVEKNDEQIGTTLVELCQQRCDTAAGHPPQRVTVAPSLVVYDT